MVAAAHVVAVTCYLTAVLLAAVPFARPVRTPLRAVTLVLALGLVVHATGLIALARTGGTMALTGLGPSLSFAGFTVAAVLLFVELSAREVTLTLAAAPLAALASAAGNIAGLQPALAAQGTQAVWLTLHIVLAFLGLAAYATAAAAGAMYLVSHHDLKLRHFGAVFRLFPPLATLDRVNHLAALAGFLGLTLAVGLAASYSIAYRTFAVSEIVWGMAAWLAIAALALGRLRGNLRARRAALISAVTFALVLALYVVVRVGIVNGAHFL
jgi:HemX protein